MGIAILLVIAALLSTSNAESDVFNPIRLPLPRSVASGEGLDCLSWRLAVETNNHQNWTLVPKSCKDYIKDYMENRQYSRDCEAMVADAIEYAKNITVARREKDVWIFDIDETTLSNLPYYALPEVQYGTLRPENRRTLFYDWVEKGEAKPVPGMLCLYKKVRSLGFKTFFLTALFDKYKEIRAKNLKEVGYEHDWTELIFSKEGEKGFKKSTERTRLVEKGYRIVGNVGDQWSDLLGPVAGSRTFKVPNPMYYTRLPKQN